MLMYFIHTGISEMSRKNISYIVLIIALSVLILMLVQRGETPDEFGVVHVNGWDIMPSTSYSWANPSLKNDVTEANNMCVAGTIFENGAVILSFIKKQTSTNVYILAIQANSWHFSEEMIGAAIPVQIMFNDKAARIVTNAVITNASRLEITLNSEDTFLFKTPTLNNITIIFVANKQLSFKISNLDKVFNELQYCFNRLN